MSSSVLHHCTFCGHDSEISNFLAAFAENPSCHQCGISASEGNSKMQDDLAALFDRQMSVQAILNTNASSSINNPKPGTPPQTAIARSRPPEMSPSSTPSTPPTSRPIVYNISQHYHHSAHQIPSSGGWSTLSSILCDMQQAGMTEEEMLFLNNVDPSSLFPSQLTLFAQAGLEQKTRLLELWQLSQPKAGNLMSLQASGGPTSALASSSSSLQADIMQDTRDAMDQHNQHAEPYVMSGYEALAQREYDASSAKDACEHAFADASQASVATAAEELQPASLSPYKPAVDSVYKCNNWWGHQQQGQGGGPSEAELLLQPMEDQYGAFEQRSNMYMGCGLRRAHLLDDQEML
ncbi:uncharacterized protein PADG_03980 [Paracoccidioides brasiliensis Pb18]|uniref:Uncharacterized protein n=2 Tax=Paracoccidioides brasiliensis TaxID=121759 RepID=C1G9P4_PARBD|nr:uncharacterized protein PADG_03980 [Paracoccidioides brasiliensis Pb18]EEH47896.2 hypothetical protein PADG_03980 [Paracoccidioides brasiliensis Pb18]ODH41305.1 hypothetical protein ACO22_01438 [Paracoccidioides brasiliensis]